MSNVAAQAVRASSFGKYRDRVDRINATIGPSAVVDLRAEGVVQWLADLSRAGLAAGTIKDTKVVLGQILDQAVDAELVPRNVAARVKGPAVIRKKGRALTVEDARRLLVTAQDDRLGAAIWLLFVGGWRVSEALGLAWDDLDLDAGTLTVRRAAVYVDGRGNRARAHQDHRRARTPPDLPRAGGDATGPPRRPGRRTSGRRPRVDGHDLQDQPVSLVFTTLDGRVLNRQAVTKAITRSAVAAGLDPAGLGTHAGRRTVITALYGAEGLDLADIARHVGHASPTTTAGYVRDLGRRPGHTADAAAALFDLPAGAGGPKDHRAER